MGLPVVTLNGTAMTASNIDAKWIGFPVVERLVKATGRTVTIVNDADAAGIAEMRFGQGRGQSGTVVVLTLGTGVGSGVFIDGRLVPNVEFGTMEIRASPPNGARRRPPGPGAGLGWKAWAIDLDEHLDRIDKLGLAHIDDPGRRGQQERRQVHPAPDGALPGRGGGPAQRRRHHRRRHRRGRGPAHGRRRLAERTTARLSSDSDPGS